ncbi:hypothetical protein [Cellulomonas palmilytica]|uniref:hypothetical protein n=1 Tax=Cellulomonas palmilytica TaxID=2608402 RepID=UPI001F33C4CE|nr:hypothetical protein [Cellulomonas palmilytica]UJP41376.1 hypothetical protein F1D97_08150 [Cellulomonas palmilytica]
MGWFGGRFDVRAVAIGAVVAVAVTAAVYGSSPWWPTDDDEPGAAATATGTPSATSRPSSTGTPSATGTPSSTGTPSDEPPDEVPTGLSDDAAAALRAALRGPVTLDPARLEERAVRRAAVVVGSDRPVALDADTGEWVRLVLPTDVWLDAGVSLSPDGTRLLRTAPDLEVLPLAGGRTTVLEPAPDPLRFPSVRPREHAGGQCFAHGAAWARGAGRAADAAAGTVLAVYGCALVDRDTHDPLVERHLAVETDLSDGSERVVQDSDGYTGESPPRYAPSGDVFVAGWGTSETDTQGVRVFGPDGPGHFWPGTYLVDGDSWRDERTVLAWEEEWTGPSDHVFLDVVTGDMQPVTVPDLGNLLGYVGGRLAEAGTSRSACAVTACFVETTTGEREPWLDLGDDGAAWVVLVADDLVRAALA